MMYCERLYVDSSLMQLFMKALESLPEEFENASVPYIEQDIQFLLLSNLPENWLDNYNLVFNWTEH